MSSIVFILIRLCVRIETKLEGSLQAPPFRVSNLVLKAGGAGVSAVPRILAATLPDPFSAPANIASPSLITTSSVVLENRMLLTVFWMIRHWYKKADYFIEKLKDPKA